MNVCACHPKVGFNANHIQGEYDINKWLRLEQYTEPLTKIFGKDLLFDLKELLLRFAIECDPE